MPGLFGWKERRPVEAPAPQRPAEASATSVVLPRFLGAMAQRPSPVLLDLGPAVGTNVSFLGERLACKLLIGDLFHDLRSVAPGQSEDLRNSLIARLERTVPATLDGVLAWDVFDYFDRATAQAVAAFLVGRLAPGGVLHGFFGTAAGDIDQYSRYFIQNQSTIMCRHEDAAPRKRGVLSTRDLTLMFPGTKVTESVLLKSQRREILLRKS